MIVPLRYAGEEYKLELPEKNLVDIIEPEELPSLDEYNISEKCKLPESLISGSFRILVVINDSFRSTPSHLILDRILPELNQHNNVRIIVATGLHRRPSDAEYRTLVGENYETFRNRLFYSDSRDPESFDLAGSWTDGGQVYVHKLFAWAEIVIAIGSVEPHYFAGFTGGIKSIIPGLAYYKTIEHNHQKAISEKSQPGRMSGNPVWESLWAAAKLIDVAKIYSYQMVFDHQRHLVGLYTGGLKDSYLQAVDLARKIYIKKVDNRYDLLIAEHSHPLDRNLYQLQKCFENTKAGVADGGTLLMLSGCREGIGTRDFFELARKYPRPSLLLNRDNIDYNLGIHKLYRTALLTNRVNLCLMSFLPDSDVRQIYIEPVADVNSKIRESLSENQNLKIIIVRDAGHTVINSL